MDVARLIEQLKLHEGVRRYPYTDTVGKTTIGVGRNLTDNGLSESEIAFLLLSDIKDAIELLDEILPGHELLSEARQLVLADMSFNLGQGLRLFKKFISCMRMGDYERASEEMLDSKWAIQVGVRATRLARIMRTNQWSLD